MFSARGGDNRNMLLQTDSYSTFLKEELARRTRTNPSYSLRAFARHLGLSSGELSEILRGKRKLSLKATQKISRALGLNATETKHLGYLVQRENAGTESDPKTILSTKSLSLDMFNILSDWYCFGILNLSECDGFRWDVKWLAKRLGISMNDVSVALERLERVGLLERKNGKRIVTKDYVISPDGVPSEAIRNYHRQMLTRAIHALEMQKIGERENTGIGFAVDPRNLASIKKDISDFLDELVEKYGRGKRAREVYQCEVALFRLTREAE
jgi:uncharacterized protein (TIGR02147 family)